jgi:hypothetical protein
LRGDGTWGAVPLRMTKRLLFLATAALLTTIATPAGATVSANGRYVNTAALNGRYVNTALLNGRYVNGASGGAYVAGPRLDGRWLDGVTWADGDVTWTSVSGSRLVGWVYAWRWDYAKNDWVREWRTIDDFTGVHFQATTADGGAPVDLRIDAVRTGAASAARDDVYYYRVTALQQRQVLQCSGSRCFRVNRTDWFPICGSGEAIALAGAWNSGSGFRGAGGKDRSSLDITFACTEAAVGKCVDQLGYKPWAGDPITTSIWGWVADAVAGQTVQRWHEITVPSGDLQHEACVRMVRADYCGDGLSHTFDGTAIDVGDSFAPSTNTLGTPSWGLEGVWTPNGASCLSEARWLDVANITGAGCLCSFGNACVTTSMYMQQQPAGGSTDAPAFDPDRLPTLVPFAHGRCNLPAGALFNRSSTILPTDSAPSGG